jgi:hypothetical protein
VNSYYRHVFVSISFLLTSSIYIPSFVYHVCNSTHKYLYFAAIVVALSEFDI